MVMITRMIQRFHNTQRGFCLRCTSVCTSRASHRDGLPPFYDIIVFIRVHVKNPTIRQRTLCTTLQYGQASQRLKMAFLRASIGNEQKYLHAHTTYAFRRILNQYKFIINVSLLQTCTHIRCQTMATTTVEKIIQVLFTSIY